MQIVPDNSGRSLYDHLADRAFLHDVATRMPEHDVENVLFTRRKNFAFNGMCTDDAAEKQWRDSRILRNTVYIRIPSID